MIEITKEHLKEAKERYYKNKTYFMKGVPFFKNISEEERIQVIAEMFAECEQKMKDFRKKYPAGFPTEMKELKCEMKEIDWNRIK